jgi:hypothetical protein
MAAAAKDLEQVDADRETTTSKRCPSKGGEIVKSIFMGDKTKPTGEKPARRFWCSKMTCQIIETGFQFP